MNFRLGLTLLTGIAFAVPATTTLAADGPGKGYEAVQTGAYSVVAEISAKPGKEAELRSATIPLVKLVRGDPKNLVYFLQEDRDNPGRFVFYEVFASKADFDAHNETPYVKDWFAKLPSLAQGGVKVTKLEILNN